MSSSPPSLGRAVRLAALARLWRPAVLAERACARLAAGRASEARSLLLEAVRRAPAWAAGHALLGACAETLGEPDAAEDAYRTALALEPGHAAAEQSLLRLRAWRHEPVMAGWRLFHAGRHAEAEQAFAAALAQPPGRLTLPLRAEAFAGIGWSRYERGQWHAAEESFTAALATSAAPDHAWKGLGMTLFRSERHDEAETALLAALARNPALHDARAFLGWCDYARGRFPAADRHFAQAVAGNPLLGDAWWGRAWCAHRLGRASEAREHFGRAFRFAPLHPGAAAAAGIFAADPALRELLLPFGQALLDAGQPARALAAFDAALGAAPRAEVAAARARALLALARAVEAEAALASLEPAELDLELASAPGHSPRLLAARAAAAAGRTEAALAILRAVPRGHASARLARRDHATLLLAAGRAEEAERELRELAADSPEDEVVRRALAEVTRRRRAPLLDALETLLLGRAEPLAAALAGLPALAGVDRRRAAFLHRRLAELRATSAPPVSAP